MKDNRSARAGRAAFSTGAHGGAAAALSLIGGIASCAFHSLGTNDTAAGTDTGTSTSGTTVSSAGSGGGSMASGSGGAGGSGGATSASSAGSGGGSTTSTTSSSTASSSSSGATGLQPGDLALYYGHVGSTVPVTRTWDHAGTTWSAPAQTVTSGQTITWLAAPASYQKEEMFLVLSNAGAGTLLELLRHAGNGWVKDWSANGIAPSNASYRGFDIEVEASSGDVLAVYSDNTGVPQYRTYTGTAWPAPAAVPGVPATGTVLWVDLVSRPGTDEISLFYSDASGHLVTVPWSGSAWGTATTLETKLNTTAYLAFGGAYESQSGDLLAIWGGPNVGGGALGTYYGVKTAGATAWTISSQLPFPFNRPGPLRLVPEPGTNRVALAYVEFTCGGMTCDDFAAATWDGNQWQDAARLDPDINVTYSAYPGAVPVDVAWIGNTGKAVAVYTDTGNGLDWATWTPGAWMLQNDVPTTPMLNQRVNVRALSHPNQNKVMFLASDVTGTLFAKGYDGNSWTDLGPALEQTLSIISAGAFAATIKR